MQDEREAEPILVVVGPRGRRTRCGRCGRMVLLVYHFQGRGNPSNAFRGPSLRAHLCPHGRPCIVRGGSDASADRCVDWHRRFTFWRRS